MKSFIPPVFATLFFLAAAIAAARRPGDRYKGDRRERGRLPGRAVQVDGQRR